MSTQHMRKSKQIAMERMKEIIKEMNSYDENGVLYTQPMDTNGNSVMYARSMRKAKQDAIKRIRGLIEEMNTYDENGVLYEESAPAEVKKCYNACNVCNSPSMYRCSRCKVMQYCSDACQYTDWKVHKLACKRYVEDECSPVYSHPIQEVGKAVVEAKPWHMITRWRGMRIVNVL